MDNLPKAVALVYDWVDKWGGAEQVLLALHEIFPAAPLYTLVYQPEKALWAKVFPHVFTSFVQKIPFTQFRHERFPALALFPLACETLDLTAFDCVISLTSAFVKGVITKPGTLHICYCLTPPRYLYSHREEYQRQITKVLHPVANIGLNYLTAWDQLASRRPDTYLAISRCVQDRIKKYYNMDSQVIYPPVDTCKFSLSLAVDNYFLWVGRLVSYKHPEKVVQVFNGLKLPLKVAGTGQLEDKLRSLAKPNVQILGKISSSQLIELMQNCRALIFFHEEDFGIVPLEVQASGRPVIALNRGGAAETVIPGITGELLDDDSPSGLRKAIIEFDEAKYNPEIIRRHARRFDRRNFLSVFAKVIAAQWTRHQNTLLS